MRHRTATLFGTLLATALLAAGAAAPAALAGAPAVAFQPAYSVEMAGSQPAGACLADFNADGHLDLGLTGWAGGEVSIFLGDGAGGFNVETFQSLIAATGIASSDFDGDGRADLAVAGGGQGSTDVKIYLGLGDGTFTWHTTLAAGEYPIAAVAGDFDEDGNADLAVANNVTRGVTIFLGNGDGTFAGHHVPGVSGLHSTDIVSGDLNLDGHTDLAVSHDSGVTVLLGSGNGSFAIGGAAGSNNLTQAVAAGELTGDGIPDLATVEIYTGMMRVCRGLGNGSFQTIGSYSVGSFPMDAAVLDVNRDGAGDVVATHQDGNEVAVFLGTGGGTMAPAARFPTGIEPVLAAAGDWDEDGWPDLAVPCRNFGDTAYASILLQIPGTDVVPPVAVLTSPAPGAVLEGFALLAASASDNVAVERVEFFDGTARIGTAHTPPYEIFWDTESAPGGVHVLDAVAYDPDGNQGVSDPVMVTVHHGYRWPLIRRVLVRMLPRSLFR